MNGNHVGCNDVEMGGFFQNHDSRLSEDMIEFARLLNYQALNRMHYLHAAITEALRLYPAVPLVSSNTHYTYNLCGHFFLFCFVFV